MQSIVAATVWNRRLLAGLLACAVFGFPLVSTLPVFLGIDSRPISMAYRALVAVAAIIVLGLALTRRRGFIRTGHAVLVLTLMALLILRVAWDSSVSSLPLDLNWDDMWLFMLGAAFLPAAAFLARTDPETLELAQRWALRLGVLAGLSIVAAATIALRDIVTFLRLDTGVLNPISIGQAGVSLFVLLLLRPPLTGDQSSMRRFRQAAGTGFGLLLAAILILASGSKGPIVAWLVVMLAWLFTLARASLRTGRGLQGVALPMALPLVLALIVLAVNAVTPLPIVDRFLDISQDQSTSERVRLLNQALDQFEESPVLGSAVIEYESRIYPHNLVVEAMMAGGVVLLVPLLVLLFENLRVAALCLLHGREYRWLAMLYLQYLVSMMFSGSIFESAPFWSMSVALLGLASWPLIIEASRRRPRSTPVDVGENDGSLRDYAG
jgi:O-antigen ligase